MLHLGLASKYLRTSIDGGANIRYRSNNPKRACIFKSRAPARWSILPTHTLHTAMALYRTERRLTWNRSLLIGYWSAPWSVPLADTGSDYLPRAIRWLVQQYPKANIRLNACTLPELGSDWPSGRLDTDAITVLDIAPATAEPANSDSKEATDATVADLLVIEWPDCLVSQTEPGASQTESSVSQTQPGASPSPADTASLAWANNLERALRRHWQANPEAEALLIGGPEGVGASGIAIAKHYGTSILDAAALIRASASNSEVLLPLLSHHTGGAAAAALTDKGQEIWAGALIAFLREQVRFGPTPEPLNLPEGLWGRSH